MHMHMSMRAIYIYMHVRHCTFESRRADRFKYADLWRTGDVCASGARVCPHVCSMHLSRVRVKKEASRDQ